MTISFVISHIGHSQSWWRKATLPTNQRPVSVAVEYYLQILGAKINEEYDDDWQENPVMRHDLTQPTSHSAYSLPAANEHLQDYNSLQHLFQEYNLSGPQVTLLDTWKAQHWDLFTHPGFLTYPHHDGAGNATFTFMRYGCKIWGAIRPV